MPTKESNISAAVDLLKRRNPELPDYGEALSSVAFAIVGENGEMVFDGPGLAKKEPTALSELRTLVSLEGIYAADYGCSSSASPSVNSAALAKAHDAVPATGAVIILPSGQIQIDSTWFISKQYVAVEGIGPGTRSKQFTAPPVTGSGDLENGQGSKLVVVTPNIPAVQIGRAAQGDARLGGVILRNFGIVGTGRNGGNIGILVTNKAGVTGGPTDNTIIDFVDVTECALGGQIIDADVMKLRNCWWTENGSGCRLDGCLFPSVTGGCFADNDEYGMYVTGGISGRITDNTFVRNTTRSLYIQGGSGWLISANSFFDNDTGDGVLTYVAQVELQGSISAAVTGNSFSTDVTLDKHVWLTGGTNNTHITGNSFRSDGTATRVKDESTASGINYFGHWETRFHTPTLTEGWSQFTPGNNESVGYRRSVAGDVQIKGAITGTGATHPFTLPAAYRPSRFIIRGVTGAGATPAMFFVLTDGQTYVETAGSFTYLDINCEFSQLP